MTAATTSDGSKDGFNDAASMVSTTSVIISDSNQILVIKVDKQQHCVLPVEASFISSLATAGK